MNFQKSRNQEFASSDSSANQKSEKINMHYSYIYGIYVMIYHRYPEVTFAISRQSMNYYKMKFDLLKEAIWQLIPQKPTREEEFMARLNKIQHLMSEMVIKDGEGNASQFKTDKTSACDLEMDALRLEVMKLLNELGYLKFVTHDPNIAMQELE